MKIVELFHLSTNNYPTSIEGVRRAPLGEVGESLTEAEDKELSYYLGELCSIGHRVLDDEGKILPKSLYLTETNTCTRCVKTRTSISRNKVNEADKRKATSRKRVEDIREAKALGLTLEEYLNS